MFVTASRRPDVSFRRDGEIGITARVSKAIGLCEGDVVGVVRQGRELYLTVARKAAEKVGKHTAVARSTKSGRYMRAWDASLCRYMLNVCGRDDRARLACGEAVSLPGDRVGVSIITGLIFDK